TFNVAMLNTQEFYTGILNPIPMQTISFYMQEGYPPKLLLTLLISKITIKQNGEGQTYINRVTPPEDFNDFLTFQRLLDELINSGITTEAVDTLQQIGPPLAASQVANLEGISKLQAQGLDLVKSPSPSGTPSYQIVQTQRQHEFCFRR